MRKKFSVLMQPTVMELNGIPCIPLESEIATEEQLIFSKSFSTVFLERQSEEIGFEQIETPHPWPKQAQAFPIIDGGMD